MNKVSVKFLPTSPDEATFAKQFNSRERRYGYYDMVMRLRGKILHFNRLKKEIVAGRRLVLGEVSNPQFIKCGLNHNDRWDGTIPVVVASNHPRFVPGTRFDYGFMEFALRDGYCISYNYPS